jgi:hypothetical protein
MPPFSREEEKRRKYMDMLSCVAFIGRRLGSLQGSIQLYPLRMRTICASSLSIAMETGRRHITCLTGGCHRVDAPGGSRAPGLASRQVVSMEISSLPRGIVRRVRDKK